MDSMDCSCCWSTVGLPVGSPGLSPPGLFSSERPACMVVCWLLHPKDTTLKWVLNTSRALLKGHIVSINGE